MKVHIRKKKLSGGGYSPILDYYHNGKRVREYLGVHILPSDPGAKDKKLLVEKIRSQRELEIANSELGYIAPHKKHIDLFSYFEKFNSTSSRKDPRLFTASLNKLKDYYSKDELPASFVDTSFCQGFRNYLGKHLKGETPSNYFKVFVRVLSEAVKDRIYVVNPASGVSNPKPKNNVLSKDVLNDNELKLLFQTDCGNEDVKRAFLFCCFTGLRGGDARALTWKNIDLKNREFKFSQSKTKGRMLPPLSETAIHLLGSEGKPSDLIFNLPSGTGVNQSLKAWVTRAKIKKHITFHCARHTFATSLLVHGTDLKTTSELLGHATTRETEKYTHISDKMKRKAVDALPELF